MNSITRRSFLQSSAITAASLTGCASFAQQQGGHIDAHVHVWTPDTEKYPLAAGFKKSDMKPASFTPEQLFAHCKPEGVSRIVLIQMSYYKTDNRYMLDMMAAHPGVFGGVAIVKIDQAGVAGRMRDLKKQGVRGFRVSPGSQKDIDAWLGSAGMAEMWKTAADEGLNICLLINPGTLEAIDKMCVKYPQTPVVIEASSSTRKEGSSGGSGMESDEFRMRMR